MTRKMSNEIGLLWSIQNKDLMAGIKEAIDYFQKKNKRMPEKIYVNKELNKKEVEEMFDISVQHDKYLFSPKLILMTYTQDTET